MKTEPEIVDKLEMLIEKAFVSRKEKFLSKNAINCVHNFVSKLPKMGKVGFCEKNRGKPCNGEDAENCPCFKCKRVEDDVHKELLEVLGDPARCGQEYPKIAMLLWVLQETPEKKKESWLGRLKQRFTK